MSDGPDLPAPQIDPRELRNAFGGFMTGVTVVTTRDDTGAPRGFTANSFTSVSLDPPLLLVCIGARAASRPVFDAANRFAVNILAEDQKAVSTAFASRTADRFSVAPWRDSPGGQPVLDDVAAWFDCAVERRIEAGDHVILIGRIESFDYSDRNGLGYARGGYFTLGLEQQAVSVVAAGGPISIGAIVERDGAIFLEPDGQGGWWPPMVRDGGDGGGDQIAALTARLDALGLQATLGPLYAVFAARSTGHDHIFYRAAASRGVAPTPPDGHEGGRYFDINALPLDQIASAAMTSMLRRYVEEHRSRRFRILYGEAASGAMRRLSSG